MKIIVTIFCHKCKKCVLEFYDLEFLNDSMCIDCLEKAMKKIGDQLGTSTKPSSSFYFTVHKDGKIRYYNLEMEYFSGSTSYWKTST